MADAVIAMLGDQTIETLTAAQSYLKKTVVKKTHELKAVKIARKEKKVEEEKEKKEAKAVQVAINKAKREQQRLNKVGKPKKYQEESQAKAVKAAADSRNYHLRMALTVKSDEKKEYHRIKAAASEEKRKVLAAGDAVMLTPCLTQQEIADLRRGEEVRRAEEKVIEQLKEEKKNAEEEQAVLELVKEKSKSEDTAYHYQILLSLVRKMAEKGVATITYKGQKITKARIESVAAVMRSRSDDSDASGSSSSSSS